MNAAEMTTHPLRSADEWCDLLDVAVNSELTNVIAAIEEALQEKRSDGSFVLNKSNGRNKLQNKLKRAKARNITKVEEESKEASSELDHLARQETSEAKVEEDVVEDQVENVSGLGQMDLDGYHGVHRLPQIPFLPWKSWDRCKHRSHVFVSGPELPNAWPYPWPCPDNVTWCTSMKPVVFCTLFERYILLFLKFYLKFVSDCGSDQRRGLNLAANALLQDQIFGNCLPWRKPGKTTLTDFKLFIYVFNHFYRCLCHTTVHSTAQRIFGAFPWKLQLEILGGDFKEISRHEKYRILSCWGHHEMRPGHEIPRITGSSERILGCSGANSVDVLRLISFSIG